MPRATTASRIPERFVHVSKRPRCPIPSPRNGCNVEMIRSGVISMTCNQWNMRQTRVFVYLQSCERDDDRPARLLERVVERGNELTGVGCERRQDEGDVERRDTGAVAQDSHNVHHGVFGTEYTRAEMSGFAITVVEAPRHSLNQKASVSLLRAMVKVAHRTSLNKPRETRGVRCAAGTK